MKTILSSSAEAFPFSLHETSFLSVYFSSIDSIYHKNVTKGLSVKSIKIFIVSILFATVLLADSARMMEEAQKAFLKQEYEEAFSLYHELALKGNKKAQNFCAGMYEFGQGVQKDDEKALYWYEKAAQQGMRSAQQTVGYRYMQGIGTSIDKAKAQYWYDKSKRSVTFEEIELFAQWLDSSSMQALNN